MKRSFLIGLSVGMAFGLQKFTPAENVEAFFVEQFVYETLEDSPWKMSMAEKDADYQYNGIVKIETPKVFKAYRYDKALVLKSKAQLHAVTRVLPEILDPKDKTLVIQYEVKLQDGLECGGAYMKLLKKEDEKSFEPEKFTDKTPYVIMFGPDKCGTDNKVHFIFNHKNPLTGKYEEKHLTSPPSIKSDKITNLYTLVVRPDNTFSILINLKEVRKGDLLKDFSPSVNPPKEIDDPNDIKPEDWVDDEFIPDETATKPEDWDENEPREIPDQEAVKPSGWLDDEPEYIRDPVAKIPEDWNVEEDGDFEAPMIRNPKCIVGCGEWKAPMTMNPKFKGPWSRPKVKNPLFIGVWAPKKIPNPDYYEDMAPHNFEPIEAIGYEIWTMSEGITFDNIYIGFDEEKAKKFAEETFSPKHDIEKAMADEELEAAKSDGMAGIFGTFLKSADEFITIWKTDSLVAAITKKPMALAGLTAISMIPIIFFWVIYYVYNQTVSRLPKKQGDNIDDLAELFKDFPVKEYEKKFRDQIENEKKIQELKEEGESKEDAEEKEAEAVAEEEKGDAEENDLEEKDQETTE